VKRQGYYNIYALINNSVTGSIVLHKKFGFTEEGLYKKTGYKLGQWWDLLIMVKRLRSFDDAVSKTRSVHELSGIDQKTGMLL
jgi:L-amino acid N-acyltransferase YncA